jgi:acetyl esterase/lipase
VKLLRLLPIPAQRLPTTVTIEERRVGSPPVTVRIIRPVAAGDRRPVILWIHGGGYVLGRARQDDAVCARLADCLGAVVVSVDYRLAPENRFPAALDDCDAAYNFIRSQAADLDIDPARVAVAGQSAGGGLAAALVQRVRDQGAPAPVLQMLIYPMLDDRTVLLSHVDRNVRLWDDKSNHYGWASYLGHEPGIAAVSSYAAPARQETLRGLPPAWIGVGTNDLFYDEDVLYAKRLREAGTRVKLRVVNGAFHGFEKAVPRAEVSRKFFEMQLAALAEAFGLGTKAVSPSVYILGGQARIASSVGAGPGEDDR